jgi:hypothetical protein
MTMNSKVRWLTHAVMGLFTTNKHNEIAEKGLFGSRGLIPAEPGLFKNPSVSPFGYLVRSYRPHFQA